MYTSPMGLGFYLTHVETEITRYPDKKISKKGKRLRKKKKAGKHSQEKVQ
jgi:hypothetical protein